MISVFRSLSALFLFLFPSSEALSFRVPEILRYDLTWTGVKAGEASLEVRENANEMTILSTAQSAKWVSLFYTVDDRVESRLTKAQPPNALGEPLQYRIKLREGRYRRDKEVKFDLKSSKAHYTDHLKDEKKDFDVPHTVLDPLSGFYTLRGASLEVGKPVYVTIFDSKKVWNVEVQVLRKERVKVPAGEFNTIVVKPLMQSEGIFYRKGEVLIWLTDDERRVPVMLRSKVMIGSVNASLTGGTY